MSHTITGVKFPDVRVKLTDHDGNAWAIMGRVRAAMRKAGVAAESIDEYIREAMAGDYDNLLRVTMETVEVE
jgi:hypothetical protein